MGLAPGHLELAAWPRRDPQLPALIEIQHAGDPLERVRVLVELDRVVVDHQVDGLALPAPDPVAAESVGHGAMPVVAPGELDRKSTRLNSSHSQISYAVF